MQLDDRNEEPVQLFRFNGYTVGKDIIKHMKMIVMVSIAAMLLMYSYLAYTYAETYTMTTTFTVVSASMENDAYTNMQNAATTATSFQTLLSNSVVQEAVAEAAGLDGIPGTITTSVVENTNLMTLSVTESDPKMTYVVMNAILDNYSTVSDKVLGSVVLTVLDRSDIPTGPDVTFAPRNAMIKTFIVAFVLMLIVVAFGSTFQDTIRSDQEIEMKIDTKRLGTLYHEQKYKTFLRKSKRKKKSILITDPTVSFRYSEAVRRLTSRVKNKMRHRRTKVLMVTSVLENEGKSTVAVNLALELVEEDNNVLLIDGDFRKPALYKVLQVDPDDVTDLGEVLNRKISPKNMIYQKEHSNLHMLLNTVIYPNSTELLSQGLLEKIISELKNDYDYIIIDCSPMALVADAEEMLGMIDNALLVVRQHYANVRDINDAIDIINSRKEKLIGCVFNDVGGNRMSLSHGGQGYGEYGNYGYGRYDHYEHREKEGE
ncbi:MAG: polysaccharide biosynthesis tyrosine autokinase [Eubacterium sp.]|nr:polysaccharide biosynthesis tyrosine autokinase [Eubacterium sp.]